MAAYPEAKVLLTLHPKGAEAWYESTMGTFDFTDNLWQSKVLELCTPFGRKFGEMSRRLIWQRSHAGTMNDRERALAHYRRHIDEVRQAVPATPFPNVNDRAQVKQVIAGITRGAYVILAGGAALIAGLAYGAVKLSS